MISASSLEENWQVRQTNERWYKQIQSITRQLASNSTISIKTRVKANLDHQLELNWNFGMQMSPHVDLALARMDKVKRRSLVYMSR